MLTIFWVRMVAPYPLLVVTMVIKAFNDQPAPGSRPGFASPYTSRSPTDEIDPMPPRPRMPALPGDTDAYYSYDPRHYLGPGERRYFRQLLGLPLPSGGQGEADGTDASFDEFCEKVDDILSRYASLPDGETRALRPTDIRGEAERWLGELTALRASIQVRSSHSQHLSEAMRHALGKTGWGRFGDLASELDLLEDALHAILEPITAIDGRQGQTQFARRETIAELEKCFDEFVENHKLRTSAVKGDLASTRDEFIGHALTAAGIPLSERFEDALR
jgi:hypothetical protein